MPRARKRRSWKPGQRPAVDDAMSRALFSGDIFGALAVAEDQSRRHFLSEGFTPSCVDAALRRRMLLLAAESLESWTVSLSRSILLAAGTRRGRTHHGDAFTAAADGGADGWEGPSGSRSWHLLASCQGALKPSIEQAVARVRVTGAVMRSAVALMLAQCANHHRVWSTMVHERGASVNESNRFGWQPLHYAAAWGAAPLVDELVSLGADLYSKTVEGATPLHVAVSHGAIGAAAALLAALPSPPRFPSGGAWHDGWLDALGRSPEDIALGVAAADFSRCARMLRVLQAGPSSTCQAKCAQSQSIARYAVPTSTSVAAGKASVGTPGEPMETVAIGPTSLWEDPTWTAGGGDCGDGARGGDRGETVARNDGLVRDGGGDGDGDGGGTPPPTLSPPARSPTRDAHRSWARDTQGSNATSHAEVGLARADWTVSRCSIAQVQDASLTTRELTSRYLAAGQPLLVRPSGTAPTAFAHRWRRDELANRVGQVGLSLEAFPYAEAHAALLGLPVNRTTVGELLSRTSPHSIFRCGRPSQHADSPGAGARARAPPVPSSIGAAPPLSVFRSLKGWHTAQTYTQSRSLSMGDVALDPLPRPSDAATEEHRLSDGGALPQPSDGATAHQAWHQASDALGDASHAGRDPHARAASHPGAPHTGRAPRRMSDEAARRSIRAQRRRELPVHINDRPLLEEWRRPAFIGDDTDETGALRTVTVQFYIGGAGGGAQPHWHGPAWNWLVRGTKRWLLWPPDRATYAQRHVGETLAAVEKVAGAPLVCDQRAGEVIVVPELWGHATLNLAPSAGFATEIRYDRGFDLGLNRSHQTASCDRTTEQSDLRRVEVGVQGGAAHREAAAIHRDKRPFGLTTVL